MSEIVKAARGYWIQGLPVVPLKDKQPLVEWGRWQTEPQTEQDFERLPWTEVDGFAIICGLKAKNGLYFTAIDFDIKNVSPEAVEKGRQILKNFPITQIEETPSKGQHWIYFSHIKPRSISTYHNLCGLELIGEGKLVIMAPSAGYRRLNDNNPTIVENLEAIFLEALQRAGVETQPKIWFKQEKLLEGYMGPSPPCIRALLEGVEKGLRNETAIRLASYLLNFRGLSRSKALAKLKAWNNRNRPPLPQKELENVLKSAEAHGYVYGCDDPLLRANCKEAECPIIKGPKKIVRTSAAELPDSRLIEEAYHGKTVYFLVYDPKTGLTEQMEQIETEDTIYKPIKNHDIKNGLTLLPSEALEYGSEEQLFKDVIDFLNRWHEPPSEFERKLDAFYVFLTYVYDLLPRLPYRRVLGPWGRGKSAWLDTVGSICYRPIILAGCDTDKAIVRRINLWRGTALIDEADFDKSSLYAFIVKILNIGYDKRLAHYTRADDINPQKTISYYVFGPKLLATREEFKDKALESRCLTFIAREKTKPMPLYRDKKFLAEAQALRNKLILWRFRKYHELKAKAESLETPELETELNVSSSRIKEVLAPLLLLNPGFKEVINELAQELEAQIKASDPDWQLEEQFNEAILRICDSEGLVDGGQGGKGLLVSLQEPEKTQGLEQYIKDERKAVLRIPLVKIAKVILNDPNPDEAELKSLNQKLSRIAKNRLGLRVVKGHGKRRVVEIPLPYKPSQPFQPSTTTVRIRVIELDDLHPLERAKDPVEEEASAEEFKPSEGVKAERKPQMRFGMLHWAGLTARIDNVWAWRAVEFTRRCNRNLPMDLTFPDGTKIEVRGPLTWFMARVKAVELFSKWRKESSPTRDSTVPGCIGLGKPIPPNQCESCSQHGDYTCFDMTEYRQKSAELFRKKAIKVRKGLRYAEINLYLCETPYRLTVQGQKALWRLVLDYITSHREKKRIYRQFFGIADDWASFTVVKADVEKVCDRIIELLTTKGNIWRP